MSSARSEPTSDQLSPVWVWTVASSPARVSPRRGPSRTPTSSPATAAAEAEKYIARPKCGRRPGVARGLAVDPEIILADEPTSALDPISSQAIEEKFIELKRSYTIVLVTHVLRQAKRIADHVVFMYMGEVVEQGPAEKIFNDPREEKTKNYLKGMFY